MDRQGSVLLSWPLHTRARSPGCLPNQQAGLSQMAAPSRQADRVQWAHVSQQMVCELWQSQLPTKLGANSGLGLGTTHLTTGCPMPVASQMTHRVPQPASDHLAQCFFSLARGNF